jgi:hypothetical protein
MVRVPRGKYIGKRVGGPPKDEAARQAQHKGLPAFSATAVPARY